MNISKPDISCENNELVYRVIVEFAAGAAPLWYSLPQEYGDLLSGSSDAPLAALLIPAMARGEDMRVDGTVSEKLYYNLSGPYQRLLRLIIPWLQEVNIYPEALHSANQPPPGVATGFTGGIDSFSVLADCYFADVPQSFRITHLLFHNTGSHGVGGRQLFEKRYARLAPLVERIGLPFLRIDSNLDQFYEKRLGHQQTHTPRSTSAALLLQGGIGRFLYASTYHYRDTFVGETYDIAYADPAALPLLSTETLEALSVGSEYTRVEKTLRVAGIADSYDTLDVCVNAGYSGPVTNCSRCKKCLRTLLTLDVAGLIERYMAVFDLDLYKQRRAKHIGYVRSSDNPLNREIVRFASERGYSYPVSSYPYIPAYLAAEAMRCRRSG